VVYFFITLKTKLIQIKREVKMNYVIEIKLGINYCAPTETIGFRGTNSEQNLARLVPLPGNKSKKKELFLMFGVDVPAKLLPYLPDMGEGSEFSKKGHWHHYPIVKSVFIWKIIQSKSIGEFELIEILQAIQFAGDVKPRVLIDQKTKLSQEGLLTVGDLKEIDEILAEQEYY